MDKYGFKDYTAEQAVAVLASAMFIIIGIIFSAATEISDTRSLVAVIMIGTICMVLGVAVIPIVYYMRSLKYTPFQRILILEDYYTNSCDINVMSRMLTNISKLTGLDAVEMYAEKEYIDLGHYVCYGDRDIERFISDIVKGISRKHYIKVQCNGYHRAIAIDLCDINKRVCVYLTNLGDKQLVSFRQLRKSQVMGLKKLDTGGTEEYKVHFKNPVRKYDNLDLVYIISLFAYTSFVIMVPQLHLGITIAIGIILVSLFTYNRYKIRELTSLSGSFIKKMNSSDSKKADIKHQIVHNIIKAYNLDEYKEYIMDVFNAQGFVYADNKIFCTNDEEFDQLVKDSLSGVSADYTIDKVYNTNGRRSAGIILKDSDVAVVISITRLDNGQVVVIE